MRKIVEFLNNISNPYGVDVHQFPEVHLSEQDSVFIKVMEKDGSKRLVFCYKEQEYRETDIEYADMSPEAIDALIVMLGQVRDYCAQERFI